MESDRIERTISFREDKHGPAVCYSSNDFARYKKPGYILLGAEDDGKGANMKIGNAELQKTSNLKTNGNVTAKAFRSRLCWCSSPTIMFKHQQ